MVPLLKLPVPDTGRPAAAVSRPSISAPQLKLLNTLRLAAMKCRTAAQADLFEACAFLSLEGETAQRSYVDTLVKCLPDALELQVKWRTPGTTEISFDEAWVLRALISIHAGDEASLAFLLRTRVRAADRRYIGFLLGRISDGQASI